MTKLPEFIFDSYKRYKADTNQLTSWLVETAQGLGYDLDLQPLSATQAELPPRAAPPARSGRPERKARKKQAPNEAAHEIPAVSSVLELKRIFVTEFTKIAKFIASSANCIKVPGLVLNLARRAIAVRKRCAEWFNQHQTNHFEEEEINAKTHQHFITVLEEVVQILNPLCERDHATRKVATTVERETLVNPFSLLDIEEVQAEDLSETLSPPVVVPHLTSSTTQRDQVVVRYTLEEEVKDDVAVLLPLFCFFEDLHSIRSFLRETWTDYRDGKIDLITASVTTNMSFDFLRSMQDDLLPVHSELHRYETIAFVILTAASGRQRFDPLTMEFELELDFRDTERRKKVEEFVYIPMYRLLKGLRDIIRPEIHWRPVYPPGHIGIYNPCQCRDLLSTDQKELEDRIILTEVFPDFFLLAKLRDDRPVQDELSKELQKLVCDKEISLLLVFATQVYLDIHHVLREQVSRGFQDLRSAGVRMATSLRLRAKNSPTVDIETWQPSNESVVDTLNYFIKEWILTDRLGNMKQPVMNRMLPGVLTEGYYLLTRHPLFCGMLQFRLQLIFQDLGLTLAAAWGTILFVSHLYEAGKHAGFLEQDSWKDMEWVMKAHDKERMFRGRIPQTVAESFKSLNLMAGASTTYFASTFRANKKNYVREKPRLSPKGPSFLKENSPVSAMFREDIVQGGVKLTAKMMEDLLAEKAVHPSALQLSQPQAKLQQLWAQTHKLAPLQFLSALRIALVAEQQMIQFDYISLHMRCIELLREIRETLHDRLQKFCGEGYMENETQLSWIVGWILHSAVYSDRAAKLIKQRHGSLHNVMLLPASQVVNSMIQREGDVECTKLAKILPEMNRK